MTHADVIRLLMQAWNKIIADARNAGHPDPEQVARAAFDQAFGLSITHTLGDGHDHP